MSATATQSTRTSKASLPPSGSLHQSSMAPQSSMSRGSLLARVERMIQIQRSAGMQTHDRQGDRRREAQRRDEANALMPEAEIERLKDDLKRLMFPLVRHAGWTKEDVSIVMRIDKVSDAVAMVRTLEDALYREGLSAPSKEAWMSMRLSREQEVQVRTRKTMREEAMAREMTTLDNMLKGLPFHPEDRVWAVSMFEIVPDNERDAVRQSWMTQYQDTSLSRESDRYREANLLLLKAAKNADAARYQATAKKIRP